ncbi:MAG: cobalamin biosynthesis protein [Rickettsiales bacterium]|nr:cobalamin biosynthesis protein [Rickettsiales bacterium]
MANLLDERLFLLAMALYASAMLGGPRWLHRLIGTSMMVSAIQRIIERFALRLNRSQRSDDTRRQRGMVLLLGGLVLVILLGVWLHQLAQHSALLSLIEMLILASLIPLRPLYEDVLQVTQALKKGQLEVARKQAAPLARRDADMLDQFTLCRAALEYLAENFADRILAPAFWYVLFGLPGALSVVLVNHLDGLVGHRDRAHVAFGRWPALCDDMLQFLPSRLSVVFLLLATPIVPRTSLRRALRSLIQDSGRFISPNSGLPVSVMAGALGVALAGPRKRHGVLIEDGWTGSGTAKVTISDVRRGQMLYAIACLLLILAVSAATL